MVLWEMMYPKKWILEWWNSHLQFEEKLEFSETLEYMLFQILRTYEDVVNVNDYKTVRKILFIKF